MGEVSGSGDEEFYGFRGDFGQKKDKFQTDFRKDVDIGEFTSLTYGGNTEESKEPNANLEERRKELIDQIELSMGFEELGEKLNDWG